MPSRPTAKPLTPTPASTQSKFFELLGKRAKGAGLELTVDKTVANVGLLHLQAPGEFRTYLSCPFNFQTGYASIGWNASTRADELAMPPEPPFNGGRHWAGTFKPGELDEVIGDLIRAALAARHPVAQA